MRFATQNYGTYTSKLPWLRPLNRTLASAKLHSPKQPHTYVQHFFCGGDIKLSVKMVWESNTSQKVFLR